MNLRRGAFWMVWAALHTPVCVQAAEPQHWITSGAEGWLQCERDSLNLSSHGRLSLGLGGRLVKDFRVGTVWDLHADSSGVWVGTGDSGSLFYVDTSGSVSGVGQTDEPQLTAVGENGAGTVLAAGAPGGALYELNDDGLTKITSAPETYVWAIQPHLEGAVIATGDPGRLYTFRGQSLSLLCDPGVQHVTGLTATDGGWVATTEGPGRLLFIASGGEVEVLYEATEPELRSPVVLDNQSICFIANPLDDQQPGRVYELNPNRAERVLWEAPGGVLHSLKRTSDSQLWVSAAGRERGGALVRVTPGSPVVWTESIKVPEPEVTDFVLVSDRPQWWSTSSVGRLYQGAGHPPFGTALSPVHDAGGVSRWGAMSLEPGPAAPGVSLSTRTGATRVHDATWSDWQTVRLDGVVGRVPSPANRFIQWKLTLNGQAEVRSVQVTYLPANRAPQLTAAGITPLGQPLKESFNRGPLLGVVQELPGGIRVDIQRSTTNGQQEADPTEATWARRYRTISFLAMDPNGDKLEYTIHIQRVDESVWTGIAADLAVSPYIWDSSTVPDGWYRIRVTVSDENSNAAEEALTAQRLTEVFVVDNTPPVFAKLNLDHGVVSGTTVDKMSSITKIEVAWGNSDSWAFVRPSDGIADTQSESFSVAAPAAWGGRFVQVRAMDKAGNMTIERVETK